MCYNDRDDQLTFSDIKVFISSLVAILAIVGFMAWYTAEIYNRPSIEYQIHKSELLNWWGGS